MFAERGSPCLCELPGQEALLKAAVHGEGNEADQPPVLQQPECGQESVAEGLPVVTEIAGLLLVDVVQKYGHNEQGQHTHTCTHTHELTGAAVWSDCFILLTEGVLRKD